MSWCPITNLDEEMQHMNGKWGNIQTAIVEKQNIPKSII